VHNVEFVPSAAFVLLSGGLDSVVCAAMTVAAGDSVAGLFFDYGQASAAREEAAARSVAAHYGFRLESIALPWLGMISRSSLMKGSDGPPDLPAGATDREEAEASRSVWVENRNAIFVNVAAAYAAAAGGGVVVAGFNREEADRFPDNSRRFVEAVDRLLEISAGAPVRLSCPVIDMNKREITAAGIELDIPWGMLWSCYRGGGLMCGRCESCLGLRRAVAGTAAERAVAFDD